MKRQRVLIVNEGGWGGVEKETYNSIVHSIKQLLEKATKKDYHSGKEKKRAKFVTVVGSIEEAMEKVRMGDVDVLIFNSSSMIFEARKIKKEYRQLKVIVLTGLLPDDELILLNKAWIFSPGKSILETVVFN
jgi:DNA-binding NarL/FixJ family response regulator